MINRIEKGMLVNFFEILCIGSFTTSSAKFNKFDAGNLILFQIKVFVKTIKETTLAMYFIKVTARPSFTRLKVHNNADLKISLYTCVHIKITP